MYRYLIDNIRPPGIPVFPFGDASYLARNTNLGSLGASGRIAMIILSCLIPKMSPCGRFYTGRNSSSR
ncbi:hypothetical protein [Anabaena sp. UHCC 0399]|uniref:hypothetical protein n=1 Tax=Anabaena sp. UHCC 0399 TaxID=3110238 RepID=UPI002B216C6A|nr:hypothetical protein [Anabaena sp. UHCC 0399]MEA5568588.1 hypothetical protein [Anabaena sp. UHCC 0399]